MIISKEKYPLLQRHPEIHDLFEAFQEIIQANQRPANETILFAEDVEKLLGICPRTLKYRKSQREIPFHSPPGQRDYWLLSDILEWLAKYRIESISNERSI